MLTGNSNNNTISWKTIQKKKNIPDTNANLLNSERVTPQN